MHDCYIMYVYFMHARVELRYKYDACPTFTHMNAVCMHYLCKNGIFRYNMLLRELYEYTCTFEEPPFT